MASSRLEVTCDFDPYDWDSSYHKVVIPDRLLDVQRSDYLVGQASFEPIAVALNYLAYLSERCTELSSRLLRPFDTASCQARNELVSLQQGTVGYY